MAKLGLSAPWDMLYMEVKEFFAKDDDVYVIYKREEKEILLNVIGTAKADALSELIKPVHVFGETKVKVTVMAPNPNIDADPSAFDLFNNALEGNEAFAFARTITLMYNNPLTYVVFKPEVVQYYTDDLGEWAGIRSTLYQEIAKEIFRYIDGVHYCTDKVGSAIDTAWL